MNKKQLLILPALFFTLLIGSVAYSADLQKGRNALEKGDYAAARKELKPLAEEGNADAQYTLGMMYYQGAGLPQSYEQAAKWYRKAAEQRHVLAQFFLGAMYAAGDGVPENLVLAYMWLNLSTASEKGLADLTAPEKEAAKKAKNKLIDALAGDMTPAQIEKARKLSRECKAKNYKNCGQ